MMNAGNARSINDLNFIDTLNPDVVSRPLSSALESPEVVADLVTSKTLMNDIIYRVLGSQQNEICVARTAEDSKLGTCSFRAILGANTDNTGFTNHGFGA